MTKCLAMCYMLRMKIQIKQKGLFSSEAHTLVSHHVLLLVVL